MLVITAMLSAGPSRSTLAAMACAGGVHIEPRRQAALKASAQGKDHLHPRLKERRVAGFRIGQAGDDHHTRRARGQHVLYGPVLRAGRLAVRRRRVA